MNWIEALILGIIQGLTEFLPVSSSGHLELGKELLGVETTENLTFTVLVHGATVLSTIVIFRKEITNLLSGLFRFEWNEETKYISKIGLSMIPIAIVGLFFKDSVESIFESSNILLLVGLMLLITATFLTFAYYKKSGNKDLTYFHSFIIGIAQTIAILPGISRSGATIATGLLIGNRKNEIAKFSFLMVLIPILGENLLSILKFDTSLQTSSQNPEIIVMIIGFVAAFVSGLAACKWMINIVKNGKLIYFAIYCAIVAAIAISANLLG